MTQILKPGYAPLEQYGQQARFGTYTDLYALAATLYHLLTGQMPVVATDRASGVELKPPYRLLSGITRLTSDATMWGLEMKATSRAERDDFLVAYSEGDLPTPQEIAPEHFRLMMEPRQTVPSPLVILTSNVFSNFLTS